LLAEQVLCFFVQRAQEIHVGIDPGAETALEQFIPKPIGKRGNAPPSVPNDRQFREDFRGVANLDTIRNSYRLTVTVESQSMTLTQDRPEACPFHRAQAVADPQGQALQHLLVIAMRAAGTRPAAGNAGSAWDGVGAS
jgi:hypothetical protein